jgi:hypothetical protein
MGLILITLINWLLKPKIHANIYLFWIFLYENIIW